MTGKGENGRYGGTTLFNETLESCIDRIFFGKEDNSEECGEVEQRQLSMTGVEDHGDSRSIGIA